MGADFGTASHTGISGISSWMIFLLLFWWFLDSAGWLLTESGDSSAPSASQGGLGPLARREGPFLWCLAPSSPTCGQSSDPYFSAHACRWSTSKRAKCHANRGRYELCYLWFVEIVTDNFLKHRVLSDPFIWSILFMHICYPSSVNTKHCYEGLSTRQHASCRVQKKV